MKTQTIFVFLFVAIVGAALPCQAQEAKKQEGWLAVADSDEQRILLLQKYLRGFDQPMWEVGERYQSMYTALSRNNPELAAYHWEKIRVTIENGIMKRPKRAKNAKSLFLEPIWPDVMADLKSGDSVKVRQAFNKAKAGCMSCHAAEQVGFMNNQPLFDLAF